LADVAIAPEQTSALQRGIVTSHATAVGRPLSRAEARAMLLLRAHVLALGHSGVREDVIDRMVEMLNRDVIPAVPEQGSLGASGDLAPLASLALPLIGLGRGPARRRAGAPRPRGGRARARGPAAARAAGEGGSRARERPPGHARDRDPRPRPRRGARADRGRRRRHDDRGRARDRRAVRRTPPEPPATSRAGRERREPPRTARRLSDPRVAPRIPTPRPGRVLPPVRTA